MLFFSLFPVCRDSSVSFSSPSISLLLLLLLLLLSLLLPLHSFLSFSFSSSSPPFQNRKIQKHRTSIRRIEFSRFFFFFLFAFFVALVIGREFECHHVIVIIGVGVRFPSRRRRLEREEFGWHFPFFFPFFDERVRRRRVDVKAVLFRMLWWELEFLR